MRAKIFTSTRVTRKRRQSGQNRQDLRMNQSRRLPVLFPCPIEAASVFWQAPVLNTAQIPVTHWKQPGPGFFFHTNAELEPPGDMLRKVNNSGR